MKNHFKCYYTAPVRSNMHTNKTHIHRVLWSFLRKDLHVQTLIFKGIERFLKRKIFYLKKV